MDRVRKRIILKNGRLKNTDSVVVTRRISYILLGERSTCTRDLVPLSAATLESNVNIIGPEYFPLLSAVASVVHSIKSTSCKSGRDFPGTLAHVRQDEAFSRGRQVRECSPEASTPITARGVMQTKGKYSHLGAGSYAIRTVRRPGLCKFSKQLRREGWSKVLIRCVILPCRWSAVLAFGLFAYFLTILLYTPIIRNVRLTYAVSKKFNSVCACRNLFTFPIFLRTRLDEEFRNE